MSEEIFDVVDRGDVVVGRETRSRVHQLGLLHRAVHVLVYNGKGEVFLQKRSMSKDRQPGLWDSSSSGHVDSGESYDAAARRELGEELGLRTVKPLRPLFKLPACVETDQEFVWVYSCESDGPFELEAREIERGGWYTPRRVTEWMAERPGEFASAFLLLWARIESEGKARKGV